MAVLSTNLSKCAFEEVSFDIHSGRFNLKFYWYDLRPIKA